MNHSAPNPSSIYERCARLGRRLFAFRLWIGLLVAGLSLEALELQNPYGSYVALGRGSMVALILAGLALRAWGSGAAGRHTRSHEILAPRLATGGPYAFLRNPIYAGSMLLGLGMCGLIGDPRALVLCLLVFAVLYLTIIPAEEKFLAARFGEEYRRYCTHVPRLVPRWPAWQGRAERPFCWRSTRGEWVIALIVAGIYAAFLLEEYGDRYWGW